MSGPSPLYAPPSSGAPPTPPVHYASPEAERAATHVLLTQILQDGLPRNARYVLDPIEECTAYTGGAMGIGFTANEVDFRAVQAALERILGPDLAERCHLKASGMSYELQVPQTLATELRAIHSEAQQKHMLAQVWSEVQQRTTKPGAYKFPPYVAVLLIATIAAVIVVFAYPQAVDQFLPAWQTSTPTGAAPLGGAATRVSRHPPPPPGSGSASA